MKLSCLPVSLNGAFASGDWTLPDWFELARALGLDGADIDVSHLQNRSLPGLHALRRQAGMAGVRIAMLVTHCDFVHPDLQERARRQRQLCVDVETASELGAYFLRINAGTGHPEVARHDGIRWAVEGLASLFEFAYKSGVMLLYENHRSNAGWLHCHEACPTADFLEIVERLQDPGPRVLFDTANAYVDRGEGLGVMEAVMERIGVVNVADIRCAGRYEPVVLGTGMVPLQPMLHRLRRHGFDGWISVEEASCNGRAGFQQAIAHCRRVWAASV